MEAPSIGRQETNGQQKTGRGSGRERIKCKCISLKEDNKIHKLLNSISLFLLANSNSYGYVAGLLFKEFANPLLLRECKSVYWKSLPIGRPEV